ncbi:unnamed protein product, partial [Amoebophrya sp. A120]
AVRSKQHVVHEATLQGRGFARAICFEAVTTTSRAGSLWSRIFSARQKLIHCSPQQTTCRS